MSLFQRHRWFVASGVITLAFVGLCLAGHKSFGLTVFSDVATLAAMMLTGSIMLANAINRPAAERGFWLFMAAGFALWSCNTAAWTYCEVVLRQTIPDPFFFDIVLFFHVLPLIAAASWRPDLPTREGRSHLGMLNALMLLAWWVFLYAFIVFPHQYVVLNVIRYDDYYDWLYLLENTLLVGVLGFAALTSSGGWRKVYLNFLGAGLVYGIASQLIDRAVTNNTYYSGSLYDVPLIVTVGWIAATALSVRDWELARVEFEVDPRLKKLVPQLAMLAILSLPALGLWTVVFDKSAAPSREFRLLAVLVAMVVLGGFVFLRQYFQDQSLIALLQKSRRGYQSQERLQSQLVQKEKLASLGTLVAGAASEINHPLTAVMNSSEQLWAQEGLTDAQRVLLRKIVNQAGRTRDLVTNLLSFAQHAPGEKTLVDLRVLLQRAVQMLESRTAGGKIRVGMSIAADVPQVRGNANQLFQVFVEIVENAMDALEEAGGGSLDIAVQQEGNEAALYFSDNGTGIREPQRVFDPFYTTKPVGKGTGLGLSAVYGVIQDHDGQISCQNKPEGGALFVVKFPAAPAQPAAQVAGATAR